MHPMNMEHARFNMVEQQIRPWLALREDIRELLFAVRREDFVPAAYRHLAFADCEIPLGHGSAMFRPVVEARALQAVAPQPHENVLEVGAGSGHLAALLAVHAHHVTTYEIVPELAHLARDHLARAGARNVTVMTGDGLAAQAAAPYDLIVVSGGLPRVPDELPARLKVGGRLFAIVGRGPAMTARLVTRVTDDAYGSRDLFETYAAPLRNAPPGQKFGI